MPINPASVIISGSFHDISSTNKPTACQCPSCPVMKIISDIVNKQMCNDWQESLYKKELKMIENYVRRNGESMLSCTSLDWLLKVIRNDEKFGSEMAFIKESGGLIHSAKTMRVRAVHPVKLLVRRDHSLEPSGEHPTLPSSIRHHSIRISGPL